MENEIHGKTREDLQESLEKENIESRPIWKPMHQQPVFSEYPSYLSGISDMLFKNGICLPSGTNMTAMDKERIAENLKKFINT